MLPDTVSNPGPLTYESGLTVYSVQVLVFSNNSKKQPLDRSNAF